MIKYDNEIKILNIVDIENINLLPNNKIKEKYSKCKLNFTFYFFNY